jgi:hydrogenase maturation protease
MGLSLMNKTAVIGIGNSILSDDAVGIKAVNALKSIYMAKEANVCGLCSTDGNGLETENSEVCVPELTGFENSEACASKLTEFEHKVVSRSSVTEFIEVSSGGINLMEYMAGFQRAVVIDAIVTGRHKAGTVFKFIYPDIPYTRNTVSTHDMDLPAALELGRHLGISLPSEIIIFAVEAKDTVNFGEELTVEVEKALETVISEIKSLLDL